MKFSVSVNINGVDYQVGSEILNEYVEYYGIDNIIPGRYSWLLIFNLMALELMNGIDPSSVIDEIKYLEGIGPTQQTKPESEFKGTQLRGLWHKHFFPENLKTMAHNIDNHHDGRKLNQLAKKIFDPQKSPVVTKEMINEFAHRLVFDSLEDRAFNNKLTGEWIIFAKHQGQNYYLCLANHESGDDNIINNIKTACLPQFTFLKDYIS